MILDKLIPRNRPILDVFDLKSTLDSDGYIIDKKTVCYVKEIRFAEAFCNISAITDNQKNQLENMEELSKYSDNFQVLRTFNPVNNPVYFLHQKANYKNQEFDLNVTRVYFPDSSVLETFSKVVVLSTKDHSDSAIDKIVSDAIKNKLNVLLEPNKLFLRDYDKDLFDPIPFDEFFFYATHIRSLLIETKDNGVQTTAPLKYCSNEDKIGKYFS